MKRWMTILLTSGNRLRLALAVWLLALPFGGAWGQTYLSTLTASNVTINSAVLPATVSASNVATSVGFEWGLSPLALTNFTGFAGIADDFTTNVVAVSVSLPYSGTRYYYAPISSNASSLVVTGAVLNFVTTSVSFNYNPPGWANINPLNINGQDPGFQWAPALQQAELAAQSAWGLEHDLSGHHQNNFLTTAMIQTGAVVLADLSQSLQNQLAGGVSNLVISTFSTQSLAYAQGLETPYTVVETWAQQQTLASTTIPTNSFASVMLEADVELQVTRGVNVIFQNLAWNVNGVAPAGAATPNIRASGPYGAVTVHWTQIIPGGNTAPENVTLTCTSNNNTPQSYITATCLKLRVWWIP
jgi:hypothetical protein